MCRCVSVCVCVFFSFADKINLFILRLWVSLILFSIHPLIIFIQVLIGFVLFCVVSYYFFSYCFHASNFHLVTWPFRATLWLDLVAFKWFYFISFPFDNCNYTTNGIKTCFKAKCAPLLEVIYYSFFSH